MRTITIAEEVRLPGTDIVLEKGDKIRVLTEKEDYIVGLYLSTGDEAVVMQNALDLGIDPDWDKVWREAAILEDNFLTVMKNYGSIQDEGHDAYGDRVASWFTNDSMIHRFLRDRMVSNTGFISGREVRIDIQAYGDHRLTHGISEDTIAIIDLSATVIKDDEDIIELFL